MTAESYIGSNVAAILDALTPLMAKSFGAPIECKLGTSEAARTGAPPLCIWVPPEQGTREYTETVQKRPDLHIKAVHDVAVSFDVHLRGASYTQCEQLEIALLAALYNFVGSNGYQLGPNGKQFGDNSPTGQGQQFLFVVPVKLLHIPLPVVAFRTVTLDGSTAPGTLTDAKGTNGISGPDAGVAP
jgi:hypothetical protein